MGPEESDRRRSRAILIGVGSYTDSEFPAIPAALNSLLGLERVLKNPDLCGWSREQVVVLANPRNSGNTARRLRQFARDADDVLLIYYVGHGKLTVQGNLCLTVADTSADAPEYTGISYEWVAQALRESPARVKVTVLDCCFSGQAIETLAASDGNVADLTHVAGVYTLTATTRNRPAHVPPLPEQTSERTSFTGELLDLVESGLPQGPPELTFADIFPHLQRRLAARGLPRPKQRGTDTALTYPFTGNVAHQTDQPESAPPPDDTAPGPNAEPQDDSTAPKSWLRSLITVGAAVMALGIGALLFRPVGRDGQPDTDTTPASAPSEPVAYAQAETLSLHEGIVQSITFSPTGKLLASGAEDGTIRLWNPETGKQVTEEPLTGHEGSVLAVAFSPNGELVASGGEDGAVHRWDPETGEKHVSPPGTGHRAGVQTVAFSPDSKVLASGARDNTIRFWNPADGSRIGTALAHNSWVFSVAFSPDGNILASASSDKTIRLWDPDTGGRSADAITGHDDEWVRSVAFSPDGELLASGGDDHAVRLWDPRTGNQVAEPLTWHEGWVLSVAFSRDGNILASGGEDGTIRVWKRIAPS